MISIRKSVHNIFRQIFYVLMLFTNRNIEPYQKVCNEHWNLFYKFTLFLITTTITLNNFGCFLWTTQQVCITWLVIFRCRREILFVITLFAFVRKIHKRKLCNVLRDCHFCYIFCWEIRFVQSISDCKKSLPLLNFKYHNQSLFHLPHNIVSIVVVVFLPQNRIVAVLRTA